MVLGTLGGHGQYISSIWDFLGATIAGDVAKVYGMAWALMFALQLDVINIDILFDSMYSFGTANAIYTPHVHQQPARIVAGLKLLLENKACIRWEHEPAHQSRPLTKSSTSARHIQSWATVSAAITGISLASTQCGMCGLGFSLSC